MDDLRKFYDVAQNTDDWMALRAGLITASIFPDFLMAENTAGFRNAVARVALERCGFEMDGFAGNAYTAKGHENEIIAKTDYENATLETVLAGGFFTFGEWCGASPDGLIGSDGLWENKSKTATGTLLEELANRDKGWTLTEGTNKAHYWQINFQLFVSGRQWVDYQTGAPGIVPNIQRLERNAYADAIIESTLVKVIPTIEKQIILINKYKK